MIRLQDHIIDVEEGGKSFKDVTPLLMDGMLFSKVVDGMLAEIDNEDFDVLVSRKESDAFAFAAALAQHTTTPLVTIAQPGVLKGEKESISYYAHHQNEEASLEILKSARKAVDGKEVIIIDDNLVSGQINLAEKNLIQELGGNVSMMLFLTADSKKDGRTVLNAAGIPHKVFHVY